MSADTLSLKLHQFNELAEEIKQELDATDYEIIGATSRSLIENDIIPFILLTGKLTHSVDMLLSHDSNETSFSEHTTRVLNEENPYL